jgi:cobalt-zinc-cadmium efflux system outer membrane protein
MRSTLLCVFFVAALAVLPGCFGAGGAEVRRQSRALDALETAAAPAASRPFTGVAALERAALVEEVLRRNPSIAAARHAWRAALARHPQETALEDPTVGYAIGPRTIGSRNVMQEAHRFEVSQAFPFPGKLALRGAAALAEAEAAGHDHEAVRLRLATMASLLYDDWWWLARAAEINREHLALLRELREIATARYESGTGEQQDPLRAELEETALLHRQVELETARRVTGWQIAALLHERDAGFLPPPAPFVPAAADAQDASLDAALAERPELRAAAARVQARESAEALARREWLPDFRLTGGYDRSWDETDMRPMVGLEWNVPLQVSRRRAAEEEARAELSQARAEREQLVADAAAEVATARERLAEAHHLLGLSRDRMLPAARDQLGAARIAFETGRVGLADVIEAERMLRDAELGAEQALADVSRRGAELRAALGRMPGLDPTAPAPAADPGGSHE